MSEYKQLQITVEDRVAKVVINNPPKGLMNDGTVRELLAMLDWAEAQPDVGAIVLTGGVEGVFIRHYDVGEIEDSGRAQKAAAMKPPKPRAGKSENKMASKQEKGPLFAIDYLTLRMEASPLPIAAAIDGLCMGGGFETALACDVRFAADSEHTHIGLPEASIGILPGGGGTQRLTRLVGPARASEMILTAAVVDGKTAAQYGLVNHVVAGDVVEAAMAWAKRAAGLYPDAVAHCKKLIQMAANETPLEEGLRMESTLFIDLSGRPEVLELMAASRKGIDPEAQKA